MKKHGTHGTQPQQLFLHLLHCLQSNSHSMTADCSDKPTSVVSGVPTDVSMTRRSSTQTPESAHFCFWASTCASSISVMES